MSARLEREGKTSVFSSPELDDRTPSALEEPGRIDVEVGPGGASYGMVGSEGDKPAVRPASSKENKPRRDGDRDDEPPAAPAGGDQGGTDDSKKVRIKISGLIGG